MAVDALLLEASYYAEIGYGLPAYHDHLERLWCQADDLVQLVRWGRAPALTDSGLDHDQALDLDRFRAWLVRLRLIRSGAWYEALRVRRPLAIQFGPVPPDAFVWDGKRHQGFTSDQWTLLSLLWDPETRQPRDSVPLAEIFRVVCRNARVDQGKALLELRKRTQKRLDAAHIPLLLDQTAGCLRLLPPGGQ
jgi:hypothetical protein